MNSRQITNNAQRSPFEAQLIERMERTNPWARIIMLKDQVKALEDHVIELIAECDRLRAAAEREKEAQRDQ